MSSNNHLGKTHIPYIDLSKYSNNERIPVNIENIIVQSLIAMDGNIEKVEKNTNLEGSDIVKRVFVKYFAQINKIKSAKNVDESVEDSIEKALTLYNGHISELDSYMANSKSKVLSDRNIRSLSIMLSRLTEVKEIYAKSYEATINRLTDTVMRFKQVEILEQGELIDESDYEDNMSTVAESLKRFMLNKDPKLMNRKKPTNPSAKKPVRVIDNDNGTYEDFESLSDAARHLNSQATVLSKVLREGKTYKGRYQVIKLEKDEDDE